MPTYTYERSALIPLNRVSSVEFRAIFGGTQWDDAVTWKAKEERKIAAKKVKIKESQLRDGWSLDEEGRIVRNG